MRNGMMKGLMAGALMGGMAATMFGVINWQAERRWNQQLRRTGRWITRKTDELAKKL